MKKIVIVDLAGGIGNQIFLFEAANYIASIDNRIIFLNRSNVDKKHSNGDSRIDNFNLPGSIRSFNFNKIVSKIYIKLHRFFLKANNWHQTFLLFLDETYNTGDKKALAEFVLNRKPKVIIITGFWQDFNYWNGSFNYHLKSQGPKFKMLLQNIHKYQPIIFHYRLGQINGNWEHSFGALSPKFLIDSISVIDLDPTQRHKDIWIFSNDLMHAKILLQGGKYAAHKFVFIDDSDVLPAELILLLAKSNVLICSNSTFSFVAAKIGTLSKVFIPAVSSKNGHKNLPKLLNWIEVESSWLD